MIKHSSLAALVAVVCLAGTAPASAQSSNLELWASAGDVRHDATNAVVLTTASTDSGETPLVSSALMYYALEPALSLLPGALPGDTYEGSGVQQSFTAAAGTKISFSWSLSTQDYDPAYADRAFVIVGSTLLPLGTVAANAVAGNFSYTFTASGSQSFAIVLMDVNDTVGLSQLNVNSFSVTAVPEPQSLALMLAGCGLVAAAVRRSSRQAA